VQSHRFDSLLITNIRGLMAGTQIHHGDRPNAHRAHDIRRDAGGFSCRLNYFCELVGETSLALGTVKWFNPEKGYGFIKPDEGGSDVFVHVTAVEEAGYTGLADGARISYELLPDRKGKQTAQNLRLG
jgi:CspA family cold shock protein